MGEYYKEGEICQQCWTPFTKFVREDCRTDEEKLKDPRTDEELTILVCLCTGDEELCYFGDEHE